MRWCYIILLTFCVIAWGSYENFWWMGAEWPLDDADEVTHFEFEDLRKWSWLLWSGGIPSTNEPPEWEDIVELLPDSSGLNPYWKAGDTECTYEGSVWVNRRHMSLAQCKVAMPPAGGDLGDDSNSFWVRAADEQMYHHYDRNAHRYTVIDYVHTDPDIPELQPYYVENDIYDWLPVQLDPVEQIPPAYYPSCTWPSDPTLWWSVNKQEYEREHITDTSIIGSQYGNCSGDCYPSRNNYIKFDYHPLGDYTPSGGHHYAEELKFCEAYQQYLEGVGNIGGFVYEVDSTYTTNWEAWNTPDTWDPLTEVDCDEYQSMANMYWACNNSQLELALRLCGDYDWYLDTSNPYVPSDWDTKFPGEDEPIACWRRCWKYSMGKPGTYMWPEELGDPPGWNDDTTDHTGNEAYWINDTTHLNYITGQLASQAETIEGYIGPRHDPSYTAEDTETTYNFYEIQDELVNNMACVLSYFKYKKQSGTVSWTSSSVSGTSAGNPCGMAAIYNSLGAFRAAAMSCVNATLETDPCEFTGWTAINWTQFGQFIRIRLETGAGIYWLWQYVSAMGGIKVTSLNLPEIWKINNCKARLMYKFEELYGSVDSHYEDMIVGGFPGGLTFSCGPDDTATQYAYIDIDVPEANDPTKYFAINVLNEDVLPGFIGTNPFPGYTYYYGARTCSFKVLSNIVLELDLSQVEDEIWERTYENATVHEGCPPVADTNPPIPNPPLWYQTPVVRPTDYYYDPNSGERVPGRLETDNDPNSSTYGELVEYPTTWYLYMAGRRAEDLEGNGVYYQFTGGPVDSSEPNYAPQSNWDPLWSWTYEADYTYQEAVRVAWGSKAEVLTEDGTIEEIRANTISVPCVNQYEVGTVIKFGGGEFDSDSTFDEYYSGEYTIREADAESLIVTGEVAAGCTTVPANSYVYVVDDSTRWQYKMQTKDNASETDADNYSDYSNYNYILFDW